VNLFRENCLEKKVADRLRCEETMAGCWRVLDPFYRRPTQFAQDLMAEITATKRIQFAEYEKLYYALLHANITEAKKANLMEALLTQANVALMEQPLHAREVEEWRSRQAKYAQHHQADARLHGVCGGPGGMCIEEHRLLYDPQRQWVDPCLLRDKQEL
jgi:hypothetical protein